MNGDLGCIKTKYIDESLVSSTGAPHANGIWIAFEDVTGNGCYSALGKAPGFRGRSPFTITELGAPSGWQLMSYGTMAQSSCSGGDEGTLMHEMLHALGVKHEHARPDRESFLNVNLDNTDMDSQFTLIDTDSWIQVFDDAGEDRFPYETVSVMHYCSMCGATGASPVMTYKDGSIFGSGEFMTTTDSLQIIWNYCNADADQGNPTETINCQSLDKFNIQRPVYTNRVCDGRFDCFGGEDEIDGSMAICIPESTLDTGCCGSYWVGGTEFVHTGIDLNGHGTWHNPANTDEIILRWGSGTWYRGTAGNPEITGNGMSYMALSESANPTNAACPPVDTSWQTLGGDQYSVLCKSSGAQFNTVNECLESPCDVVATCTDTVGGFTCACPSTHSGDGVGAGSCTEIILEDECANNTHNCPEICNDQQIGFTCACQEGQFDANGDGLTCSEVEPCCEVFKVGLSWANYKLLCTHERTHSGTGFMDYNCEADPEFANTPTGFTMPAAVQYVANVNPPGYFLTNGVGVIPEDAGHITISIFTSSTPPTGAICPSLNTADWAQTSGQDWGFECVQFVTPDTPSDPDQCTDLTHNCSTAATCNNTDTGFTCHCNEGFGGDGVTCIILVDECAEGTDNCDVNAFCTNTPEAFDCVCLDGFNGDGFSCTQVDVNECEDGTHQCDESNSVCVNTEGDYQCNCINPNTWQQVDDKTCADFDECASATTTACTDLPNTMCNNVVDHQNQGIGFTCDCISGHEAGENGCVDTNECAVSPSPCGVDVNDSDNQICTNLPGDFECSCKHNGFEMSAAGDCIDTDECAQDEFTCGALPCVNLEGSFTCECQPGFDYDAANIICVDTDECFGDPCMTEMANPAACVNTEGSYECLCEIGFAHTTPNANECADIDECDANIDGCSVAAGEPAQCFNFEGGYECECAAGFVASTDQMRTTGFHCIDVDECAFGDICDSQSGNPVSCVNIEGGFTCECNEGFTADSTGACLDHNECENNPCAADLDCVNVEGGFECHCPAGSQPASDGNGADLTCEDIDECVNIGQCHRADGNAAICTNTPGSYQCDCEQGFLVDDDGWCNDIDECNLFRMRVSCSANTDCVNTPGSFECTCKAGFEGEQRNFGTVCIDVDECSANATNTCPVETNCVNLPGTFDCECPTGTTNIAPEGQWECSQDDPCAGVECQQGFECVREEGQGFCADMDECTWHFGNGDGFCTESNAMCVNLPGSFECQCPNTLVMDNDGICVGPCSVHECPLGEECSISEIAGIAIVDCVDINECLGDASVCHESAFCQNTAGAFNCTCVNDGEVADHMSGTTVCLNPCADLNCPTGSQCTQPDQAGATDFWCVCSDGAIALHGENGLECPTTDVCAGVECPENASCNAAGTCDCSEGFIMNENAICEQSDLCSAVVCETGFVCDDSTGECVDIDECADNSHMCDSFEQCVNQDASYSCTFDASQCPPESPVIWKGAKFGRVFYRGDSSIELRVTITNKNIDVKSSTYYGMLMFGKKKCGADFLRALTDGRVQVDVMDADHIYNVIDIYNRDDSSQSSTQIMFNLFNTETVDYPFSKKKGESMKKDQMLVSFWNLHTVNWGNKDWEECLELATVGAVQQIAEGDENFTNACATWQKTLWN